MNWFRNHWFDAGGMLAVVTIIFLLINGTSIEYFHWLIWLNLVALWVHQLEEYKYPGTFPKMINTVMFPSDHPDRFPLNTNTSMIINTGGWLIYFMAALLPGSAVWLSITAIMVSIGNFIAHTFLFNIRGKTIYNPGMFTSWVLFLPIIILFFWEILRHRKVSTLSWIVGVVLGVIVNIMVIALIKILADKSTPYRFRNISPQ